MVKKSLYILIIISVLLTSCTKEPIKIGFSANLTGTGSEIGTNAMYGAYLAVDKTNEAGGINGRTVELLVKNDGNDINTAIDADKELIEEGVVAIIGHLLSANGQLAIPYTNENEVIMVSPTISSNQYTQQDDFFFTMMPDSIFQSTALSEALINHQQQRIGLLYQQPNEAFSKPLVDAISDQVNKDQQIIFNLPFDTSQGKNFQELLTTISTSQLDALVIIGPGFDVAKFTQAFAQKDLNVQVYSSIWTMTNDFLNNAGPTANGTYIINYYDSESQSESFIEFREDYEAKYGATPAFGAMFSYEATTLLLQAIESANTTESQAIKEALLDIHTFDGLLSPVVIDPYGDVTREMFLFQVQDEKFVKVTQ